MKLLNWLFIRPLIEPDELIRLRRVEELAAKMVELLEDGKVDYDLLRLLKGILDVKRD